MKETVTAYKAAFKRKGLHKAKFRIAFLTDFHSTRWKDGEEGILCMLKNASPDLVLIGGDMMTARPEYDNSEAVRLIKALADEFEIYFARGNHEFRADLYRETYGDMYDRFMEAVEDPNIHFLNNESAVVNIKGQDVRIYGLEIPAAYYRRGVKAVNAPLNVERFLQRPADSELSVLLAHNPKYLDDYFRFGCDLTLCGHYHGGLLGIGRHTGLVDPDIRLFPKTARGKFKKDGHIAIVSAGMGEHTIPVRLNLPREIVMIDVVCNPDGKSS